MRCTELHCTALRCTELHCTAVRCTELHCNALLKPKCFVNGASAAICRLHTPLHTARYCTKTWYCTTLFFSALHCTALNWTALHCSELHYIAMHWTAIHCTARQMMARDSHICLYLTCKVVSLHFTAFHCTLHLHLTALQCTEMQCSGKYWTETLHWSTENCNEAQCIFLKSKLLPPLLKRSLQSEVDGFPSYGE